MTLSNANSSKLVMLINEWQALSQASLHLQMAYLLHMDINERRVKTTPTIINKTGIWHG